MTKEELLEEKKRLDRELFCEYMAEHTNDKYIAILKAKIAEIEEKLTHYDPK